MSCGVVPEGACQVAACSSSPDHLQDLEILKGYVPGYNFVMGHEFVGVVAACSSKPELVGKRVVGEINCPLDEDFR